ncbi:MAG: hypothetical protein E7233_06190 [Lachnospiraceae bacterium]|nr:hypothetical protein [Lachnospiraceae bacterium]
MEEIKKGILAGVKIPEEKADTVGKLADKLRKLDNGKLDLEEAALGDMMGASATAKEEYYEGKAVDPGKGTRIAKQGVLTGVNISESQAETLGEVSKTIDSIEEYERSHEAAGKDISDMGDALASAMGVDK